MNTLFLSLEKKKKRGDWKGDNSPGPYSTQDAMTTRHTLSHAGATTSLDLIQTIKVPQRAEKLSGPFYQTV